MGTLTLLIPPNANFKIVKFVKSQEWKQRMMEFNNVFIEHRTALLQLLSIRMARGVDDLHTKMDALLAQAFNTNQEWEKRVQKRLRQYGSLDSWITDLPKIQLLILVFSGIRTRSRKVKKSGSVA